MNGLEFSQDTKNFIFWPFWDFLGHPDIPGLYEALSLFLVHDCQTSLKNLRKLMSHIWNCLLQRHGQTDDWTEQSSLGHFC